MNENTAPIDNRPLLPDFNADYRALTGFDFLWFTVESCEVIAPMREQLRNEEEVDR